ncbi:MAG: metal-dependent transcriptional regulator [Candidatus Woesearchaeota archaeon]
MNDKKNINLKINSKKIITNFSNKLHVIQKNKISKEMYLKTIYLFFEKKKLVKAIDLANELKIKKSSVSEMLKKLFDEKLITIEQKHHIKLTKKGEKEAKNVLRKYLIIKEFLIKILKIKPEKAELEACELEHAFSDESIAKLNILNLSNK